MKFSKREGEREEEKNYRNIDFENWFIDLIYWFNFNYNYPNPLWASYYTTNLSY